MIKGRPSSTVKVPDSVADWKQSLWRRIWRSAFMVLRNETLSRRIANGAVKPDAVKDFVQIPDDVPQRKTTVWARVYQKSVDVTGDKRKAKDIAYRVTGRKSDTKSFLENSSQKVTTMASIKSNSGDINNSFLIHRIGGDIKVADKNRHSIKSFESDVPPEYQGWIEGYLVSWGNTRDTDLQGEFFTPNTEFCLNWFEERPVLYHHGMDDSTGLKKIGTFKTIKADDIGLWVQAQLDLRDKYAQAVYDMTAAKQFGWSSGSVDHLVKISESGEILVWPLIEGSVTPTPAQPSKTAVRPIKGAMEVINQNANEPQYISMRAFKAVLSGDRNSSSYLRGLDAYLSAEDRVVTRDVPNSSRINSYKSSLGVSSNMTRNDSAWYITRAVAKAFGIKDATPEELEAVAAEVDPVVKEEITVAAADALNEEAMATDELPTAASYRSRRRNQGYHNRGYRNYGYRTQGYMGDPAMMQDGFEDPESVMMEEITSKMEMEEAEKMAVRQFKLNAMRRAMKEIAEGADGDVVVSEMAIENPRPMAQDTLPSGGKWYGRRSSYRTNDALLADEISAIQSDDADDVVADVAVASYRRGFRSGMNSAMRQIEENVDAKSAEEEAVASEEELVSSKTGSSDAVEEAVRAYRAGYRRGLKRAIRQIEDETKAEEEEFGKSYGYRNAEFAPTPMVSETPPTEYAPAPTGYEPVPETGSVDANTKARRARARRGYQYGPSTRGYGYRNQGYMGDPAMMQDDIMADPYMADPYMGDDQFAQMGGFMSDPMADSVMMDDYTTASDPIMGAYMTDDIMADPALMGDPYATDPIMSDAYMDEGLDMAKHYRGRRSRAVRSAEFGDSRQQAAYWRNRALSLEQMEAPNQRAFKSLSGIKDVADREGAYEHAFKSYLQKGLGLMMDNEKYILQGKGKTRWENTTFAFDNATKSVKTYNSSSDTSGGFLVPEDWVNELNKNVMTQTVMAAECRTRTTTSDRIVQPSINTTDGRRAHAAQVRWPGESPASNTEHRSDEDTYEQVVIPIHVMLISLAATNSSLEDSTFNLEEEINEAFAEAVAVSYDQLIWGGDGQGKMQGIIQNPRVTGTESLGVQSVGGFVITGDDDGIVSADTLKQMLYHLPQGYRTRAKWYMNSNTGLQVATLKDGEGNYLIDNRDEGLRSVGIPDRLLGKPIVYNEWASDIATGGFPIVLGDLSRGYVIGRRVEFSIKRFDDSNYAEHDQVLFLGRARLGGQVLQPAAFKVLKVAATAS